MAHHVRRGRRRRRVVTVEPLGTHRCRVRLDTQVRPHGVQRLLAPVLRGMLRRGLAADARRLRALAEAAPDRP